LKNCESILR